jgi:pyruvate-formate lyase-activating enzyme
MMKVLYRLLKLRVSLVPGINDSITNTEEIERFEHDLNLAKPVEYLNYNLLTKSKYQKLSVPYSLE